MRSLPCARSGAETVMDSPSLATWAIPPGGNMRRPSLRLDVPFYRWRKLIDRIATLRHRCRGLVCEWNAGRAGRGFMTCIAPHLARAARAARMFTCSDFDLARWIAENDRENPSADYGGSDIAQANVTSSWGRDPPCGD